MQHSSILTRLARRRGRVPAAIGPAALSSSSSVRALSSKCWVMKRHFEGEPTKDDFEMTTGGDDGGGEALKPLQNGEILTKALFWSVDPYMRAYPKAFAMKVAEVVESKNPKYPVGATVVSYAGWRDYSVVNPDEGTGSSDKGRKSSSTSLPVVTSAIELPPQVSKSHLLGALGMPGNTAYYGLMELCQPKEGETVVVSGAAGAVGSLVGQIAKIKGCRAIGLAGTDEKCRWLKDSLGYDEAINYKTKGIRASILRVAPSGVDCYFDNVGGKVSYQTMSCMRMYGRVAVCGSISVYNDTTDNRTLEPPLQPIIVGNQLRLEGFFVWRWLRDGLWNQGLEQMRDWMVDGKLTAQETIVEGFENMPSAFIGLLRGDNMGKMVVRATE